MCHTELLHICVYLNRNNNPIFSLVLFSFLKFDVIFCASFDQRERYFFAHIERETRRRTAVSRVRARERPRKSIFPLGSCCVVSTRMCVVDFSRSTSPLTVCGHWLERTFVDLCRLLYVGLRSARDIRDVNQTYRWTFIGKRGKPNVRMERLRNELLMSSLSAAERNSTMCRHTVSIHWK